MSLTPSQTETEPTPPALDDDGLEMGEMAPDEVEFVIDSLAKSFRASPWAGMVPNHMYHPVTRAGVTGLLERGAQVLVGRAAGRVLGWVLCEHKAGVPVLHYVYVKEWARRTGLARRLLAEVGVRPGARVFYTYRTKACSFLLRGVIATHAPEMARRRDL